jgi:hypothetical protein
MGGYRRHFVVFTVALAIVGAGCGSSGHSASAFCKELQSAGASGVGVSLGTRLTTHPGAEQLVALDLEIKRLQALAPNSAVALALESYDNAVLVAEQTGDNQPILRMTGDPLVQPFVQYAEHDCQLQSIVRVATSTTKPAKNSAAIPANTCALATEAEVQTFMNTYLSAGTPTHKLAHGQCTWESSAGNQIIDVEFTVLAGNAVTHRSGDDKITGLGLDNSLHYGSGKKGDIAGISVTKDGNTLVIALAGGDAPTKSAPHVIDNEQKKSAIITLARQAVANL